MSSSQNADRNNTVDRRLLKTPLEPLPPSRFRSWEDQKNLPSDLVDKPAAKATATPLPRKRRKAAAKLWWNRDLRVIVAIAVTAGIAYFVYLSLKG